MIFIASEIVVLFIIIFLIYLITWFLPTDSPWSPWWATSSKISRRLCRLVKLDKNDIFYELGSGTGTTCVIAAKDFNAKAIGIESSKSRIWWSKMKAKKAGVSGNVTFLRKDFFTANISSATVVYFYLVPRVIKKLKPKLLKDLKPGTKVISYMYEVDYLPLDREDDKSQIYIYKIPYKK